MTMTRQEIEKLPPDEVFNLLENYGLQRDDALQRIATAEVAIKEQTANHAAEVAGLNSVHAHEIEAIRENLIEARAIIEALGGTELGKRMAKAKAIAEVEAELATKTARLQALKDAAS